MTRVARLVRVGVAFAMILGWVLASVVASARPHDGALVVGSKRFPESAILGELVVLEAEARGLRVRHEDGLGGTAVTLAALEEGSIDVYPEYTGTLRTVLGVPPSAPDAALDEALRARKLVRTASLGFENTYALAVARGRAKTDAITTLSGLRGRSDLSLLVSSEFLERRDGWPGLAARYRLDDLRPASADHALAYEALRDGKADVVDVYTTDGKIARYGLRLLDDDAHFFPEYRAVFVHREDLATRLPGATDALVAFEGKIDVAAMTTMNARVEIDRVATRVVAADFRSGRRAASNAGGAPRSLLDRLGRVLREDGPTHLALTAIAVSIATAVGVPAGFFATRRPRLGALVVATTSVLQTIPSLALLGVLVPLLGIGARPALVALTLYGLLPIVRGTIVGLSAITESQRRSARVLGLSRAAVVGRVEFPLALPSILAGVRTSTSLAVGTATLAAFVGAGGFGKPISAGLALADGVTVLSGAIPAAALALVLDGALALLGRWWIAAPLRS